MTITQQFGAAGAALLITSAAAFATPLTLDSFSGSHYHVGGNVGEDYRSTTVADRTEGIPITPGGLAFLSTNDIYSGDIPSVASVRLGRGEARATTVGLIEDDGFFVSGAIESVSTCTFKDQLSGCIPFMTSQSRVTMEFTVDTDQTLFLDGTWFGGNGTESLVSTVDFFGLSIRQLRDNAGPLNIYNVDTNIFNRNEPSGIFDGQLSLLAGTTYEFAFFQSASSQSPDVSGASDSDNGVFSFAASFVETNDVAFYEGEIAAMMAPVPLPAGGGLLLMGIGALSLARARRKSQR